MGVKIEFTFQHDQFSKALAGMTLTPERKLGLLRAIGVGLRDTTQARFASESDPQGHRWAALSPAYAADKPAGLRILSRSGQLQASLTFSADGAASTVTVGSNKVYAAVHQFGAVIQPKQAKALVFQLGGRMVHAKRVTIRARPYLGFGPEDELVVLDALDVLLPGGR